MKGKNAAYPEAMDELKEKEELSKQVELRQNKYFNNRVEQDHRFPCAIDKTRNGISLVQHSSTNIQGIWGDEYAPPLDNVRVKKGDVLARTEYARSNFWSSGITRADCKDCSVLTKFCNTTVDATFS